MITKDDLSKLRMNEFGLHKVSFLDPNKDIFPNCIDVVKWVDTEPMKVFSLDENKYIERTSYCYVIGRLAWDDAEYDWDFCSVGTRFLEDGNEELMQWLLDFCKKYKIEDNKILERV